MMTARKISKHFQANLFWMATWLVSNGAYVTGKNMPYDPDKNYNLPRLASSSCGIVSTNKNDPDWKIVTSDRILRRNRCKADTQDEDDENSWYEKVFDPCHNDARYWKVSISYEKENVFVIDFNKSKILRDKFFD